MTATDTPIPLDPAAHLGLVQRGWLTHDAMWFANCLARLGIEVTNELNRSSVRAMAAVEAKRVAKVIGLTDPLAPGELRRFIDTAIILVIPTEVMTYAISWEEGDGAVTFEVGRCFAFEGTSALGVADRYQCGIFERIVGWLDELGVPYAIEPDVAHCTMHHRGWCRRTFRFTEG